MFTGIVEERGTIVRIDTNRAIADISVRAPHVAEDLAVGDSVAVDGCCLTATHVDAGVFAAQLTPETMTRTTFGDRSDGDAVNLERPLAAGSRLGGHLVLGHVDATGAVAAHDNGVLIIDAPAELARYLVAKGSVTVAGVSLTIVDAAPSGRFSVALIPHTAEATTLGALSAGARVNLEVDVIAKHVERLLAAGVDTPYRPASTSPEDAA